MVPPLGGEMVPSARGQTPSGPGATDGDSVGVELDVADGVVITVWLGVGVRLAVDVAVWVAVVGDDVLVADGVGLTSSLRMILTVTDLSLDKVTVFVTFVLASSSVPCQIALSPISSSGHNCNSIREPST